jgi:hypothetical protein
MEEDIGFGIHIAHSWILHSRCLFSIAFDRNYLGSYLYPDVLCLLGFRGNLVSITWAHGNIEHQDDLAVWILVNFRVLPVDTLR